MTVVTLPAVALIAGCVGLNLRRRLRAVSGWKHMLRVMDSTPDQIWTGADKARAWLAPEALNYRDRVAPPANQRADLPTTSAGIFAGIFET